MIYLDHAATTPVDRRVLEAMLPFFGSEAFGNASSPHARGRASRRVVAESREAVAGWLGCDPARLVFTSGATESLNTVIKGLAGERDPARDVLLVSSVEHKAVLDSADAVEQLYGVKVVHLEVDSQGIVELERLAELLRDFDGRIVGVAVMAANNETGVVQPIRAVADLVAEHGSPFLCDVTQAAPWGTYAHHELPGEVYMAASAHKMHGPQGVGALVLPPKSKRSAFGPLLHGGGHEDGMRSGTTNLPGVVGYAGAVRVARESLDTDRAAVADLAGRLSEGLVRSVGAIPTLGSETERLPNFVSLHIPGVDADALIANCPDVAFASGSACTAAVPTPSHVLLAMGLPMDQAEETVRLSLARTTTEQDVAEAVRRISSAVERIRAVRAGE